MGLTLGEAKAVAKRLSRGLEHADVRVQKIAGTYSISVLVIPEAEIGFDEVRRIATVDGLTTLVKSGDLFDEFLVLEEDYTL